MSTREPHAPMPLYASHPRSWRENLYVYPVISRRSGGLSVGINLNPDKACNFNCVYCQVDRSQPGAVARVDLARLRTELEAMLRSAAGGELFAVPPFDRVLPAQRGIRDIAFSGDGEPTGAPEFPSAVQIVAELRQTFGLSNTKIVLITNAAFLHRPAVREALALMDANNGEIWAKLDAGTEDYFRQINRATVPLERILDNVLAASRVRPVVIQSLWMKLHDEPPPQSELEAFARRLAWLVRAGGRIRLVQVYTVARQTAEPFVEPLGDAALRSIAEHIKAIVDVPVEIYGS
ncbi:MAG: radical SAM protein [Phycisphaerae bacterium]